MRRETEQNIRPTYRPLQAFSFEAFNTINVVHIYEDLDPSKIIAAMQAESARFEQLFSHTLPGSSLVRLNQAGGQAVEVEPELAELIAAALRYCEATDGLFDITVGPLVELWKPQNPANADSPLPPEPEKLKEACTHVNWRGVHVEGNVVQLEDPDARIVLGGIAKGYIADKLCTLLQEHGIKHAFVNLGGTVKAFGGKPLPAGAGASGGSKHTDERALATQVEPYVIGLRVPQRFSLPENAFAHVEIESGAVVTSGIYERGLRTEDGSFYHHVLDPRTGMPAETDIVSVSLISETALDGDGYTTALIGMGLQAARAFVEALPGCEAVFVTNGGEVVSTSGVGSRIPFALVPPGV